MFHVRTVGMSVDEGVAPSQKSGIGDVGYR